MFRKICNIITVILCVINGFLAGSNRGYALHQTESLNFDIYGMSGYEFLSNNYIYISLFLLVFLVGGLVRNKILSNAVCISTLLLMFPPYWNIYLQKNLFLKNGLPVSKLLLDSIPIDLISFSLISFLLIYQVIMIFQHCANWKHSYAEIK